MTRAARSLTWSVFGGHRFDQSFLVAQPGLRAVVGRGRYGLLPMRRPASAQLGPVFGL